MPAMREPNYGVLGSNDCIVSSFRRDRILIQGLHEKQSQPARSFTWSYWQFLAVFSQLACLSTGRMWSCNPQIRICLHLTRNGRPCKSLDSALLISQTN